MTDLEIVKWLREEIDRVDDWGRPIFINGLCYITSYAFFRGRIDSSMDKEITNYIYSNVPKRKNKKGEILLYSFPRGEKQPRVEWLDEQIKKREA